jgi:hypothetical protein
MAHGSTKNTVSGPVGGGASCGSGLMPTRMKSSRWPSATVIIPPRAISVASETTATPDQNLAMIDEHGRMGWQRGSGYNQRSLVETAMFRHKTIIGWRLQSRTLPNQKTEAKIGCNMLNRMAGLGAPASAGVR